MARNCPHCGASLTFIHYLGHTQGWESGRVSDSGEWDYGDSETTETTDYEFTCPRCDSELRSRDCGGVTPVDWITQGEDSDWTEPTPEPDIWTNAG